MPFVLDASVTVCWGMEDEQSPTAQKAKHQLLNDYALVPALWWFEVRGALLAGERRGRTSPQKIEAFLVQLDLAPVRRATNPNDDALFQTVRESRLTIYDAAYLELAQRLTLPLATLDRHLAAAACAAGVALL